MLKILVTGSRTWTDKDKIREAIDTVAVIYQEIDWEQIERTEPIIWIIHGNASEGADKIANDFAEQYNWLFRNVPVSANWSRYKNAAGPIRNAEMVRMKPTVCLAFVMPCSNPKCHISEVHDSHGTTDCIKKARAAGIPIHEYRYDDPE